MATERPILFQAEMVRAILAGQKTQTRRIIRPQPIVDRDCLGPYIQSAKPKPRRHTGHYPDDLAWWIENESPYGVPGDILWVRENSRVLSWGHLGEVQLEYPADGTILTRQIPLHGDNRFAWEQWNERMCNKAEALGAVWGEDNSLQLPAGKQYPITPSIHMPRWASRLTLLVKDVRVERVKNISEADAQAEGIAEPEFRVSVAVGGEGENESIPNSYRGAFANLWDRINKPRGYGWAENPWCWVIEFEVQP